MRAGLAKKRVKPGKTEKISGTTAAGGTVTIQIWTPHRYVRSLTTAGAAGAFSKTFKVGKIKGNGAARACVSDADKHSACSGRMTFAVR